jgi:hypothetical protein
VILGTVAWLLFRSHASVFEPLPLALGMFFSAYAALVLLGYLLLAVGHGSAKPPAEVRDELRSHVSGDA